MASLLLASRKNVQNVGKHVSWVLDNVEDGFLCEVPTHDGSIDKALPESSLWKPDDFFKDYADATGNAVGFQFEAGLWKRDRSLDRPVLTVDEYRKWFLETIRNARDHQQAPTKALYLANITVHDKDAEAWYKANPLISIMSESGLCDLQLYIRMYKPALLVPDLKCRLYLAPPLYLGSPPHFDGGGSSVSVHSYLWGGGFQLISGYPRLKEQHLEPFLEAIGRKLDGPWFFPHNTTQSAEDEILNSSDISNCCFNKDVCNLMRGKSLPRHSRTILEAGHTVFLPEGAAHAFKKVPHYSAPFCWSTIKDWTERDLMASIAGLSCF